MQDNSNGNPSKDWQERFTAVVTTFGIGHSELAHLLDIGDRDNDQVLTGTSWSEIKIRALTVFLEHRLRGTTPGHIELLAACTGMQHGTPIWESTMASVEAYFGSTRFLGNIEGFVPSRSGTGEEGA